MGNSGPLQVWHMILRHKQGRGMNSAACGVPRNASTTVTEEPGVGGVDQVVTSMAHLGTCTAAALAVYQPTCVAEVPAASMRSGGDLQQVVAMS